MSRAAMFPAAPAFACAFALSVALSAVTVDAQSVFQQRPLTKYLDEHAWISLSIPDNKMRPGSVIKVKAGDKEARWLGDFRSCGVADADFGFVRGKYPALGVGEDFAVKASLAASFLKRIGFSAEAEKVSGAVLKIEDSGGDAIDLLAFSVWMARPGNLQRLPEACTQFLAQDDVYLVTEAFRISKGSYQLVDKAGAKISLSATVPKASASAQAGVSIGSQGTLEVTEDFYFGVRHAKQLKPGSFQTLGNDPQAVAEADGLLRRMSDAE